MQQITNDSSMYWTPGNEYKSRRKKFWLPVNFRFSVNDIQRRCVVSSKSKQLHCSNLQFIWFLAKYRHPSCWPKVNFAKVSGSFHFTVDWPIFTPWISRSCCFFSTALNPCFHSKIDTIKQSSCYVMHCLLSIYNGR